MVERAGFSPASHDGKALLHILETYPRDELFQIDVGELLDISLGVLHLQERQRTALFVRHDPFERFVSCMVYVPRDRFDTRLRLKIQALLAKAYAGEVSAFSTQLGDALLARLHVIVKTTQGQVPRVDVAALEAEVAEAARSWTDEFEAALIAAHGEHAGLRLYRRYADAFPSNYREAHLVKDAVADLANVEATLEDGRLAMDLYRPHKAMAEVLHFKLYVAGEPIPLSDVLPMLEQMGLRVISEVPYEVWPKGSDRPVWIHDFSLRLRPGQTAELGRVRAAFHEVFALTWADEMEGDRFKRPGAGGRADGARDPHPARLRQVSAPGRHPLQSGLHGRDSRRQSGDRRQAGRALRAALRPGGAQGPQGGRAGQGRAGAGGRDRSRAGTPSPTSTRTASCGAISTSSAPRCAPTTSSPTPPAAPSPTWRLKLDSRAIEELPEPRPYREIFVYAPQVEGVHLRFGPGRARRPALVGPARGLPHRGAGPGQGAAGQERRDRPRSAPRAASCPSACRRPRPGARPSWPRGWPPTRPSSARCWTSPTT